MSKTATYKINIIGLSNGAHEYDFNIRNNFFEKHPHDDVKGANCQIELILRKSTYQIVAEINIKGTLTLECDRSLEEFPYKLEEQIEIYFKYNESNEEIDDTLFHITPTLETLDFEDILYQSIGTSIPMKKIHPEYIEEDDFNDDAEEVLIYSSKDGEEIEDNDDICDSRWEALKNLNIDNNKNKG